jgi:hypothetical protein
MEVVHRAHAGSPPIGDYKRTSMQNARTSFDASFRSREIGHDLMAKATKQGAANAKHKSSGQIAECLLKSRQQPIANQEPGDRSAYQAHCVRGRKSEPHGAPHWLALWADPELADDRIESVAQVPI